MSSVPGQRTILYSESLMKSQDVYLLLKLICLQDSEKKRSLMIEDSIHQEGWQGWEPEKASDEDLIDKSLADDPYTARALEALTGISKTEISASLKRSMAVGLCKKDRLSKKPVVNRKALYDFLIYGIRYVFPAKLGAVVRGIPTSISAPVFEKLLHSSGELKPVWPDPYGKDMGVEVQPLYSKVPKGVKTDSKLYELLVLVDALRLGKAREFNLAVELLKERMLP